MNPFVVTVEGKEYDVDAPDEQTAWAWANEFHRRPNNAEERGLWDRFTSFIGNEGTDSLVDDLKGIPRGLVGGLYNVAHGAGVSLGGIVGGLGATDLRDKIFKENDELLATNRAWLDSKIAPPKGMPGKVLEGVANLPAMVAGGVATLAPSIAGGAVQDYKHNVGIGVPPDIAKTSAYSQAAGMSALALIPALKPVAAVIVNLATGAAADEISAQILSEYKEAQAKHRPMSEDYWVNRAVELVASLALSKKGPPKVKIKEDSKDVSKGLDTVEQERQANKAPQGENIWDLIKYKEAALAKQEAARNTPIEVTPEGQIVPRELTEATRAIDEQPITAPQYGRGINPEANRQAAMQDMRVKAMSLADELPPRDGGTRPVGTDGTPLRGMAEDIPTIDFPLRQEVLDSPQIKEAIDNFRLEADRLTREGNQEGLDQLTRDFTAGMQRLGIANPQDAFGRALYEGGENARYLETGIRRGGEPNRNLATVPEMKQLPFGGKQPLPEEVRAYSDAIRNLKTRNQSGAVDLQVYKEGFKRFTRALSRLTDQPWLKARFPASEYMTNSDNTPLVMLHGTKGGFKELLPYGPGYSDQGIHLGFTVPSHLIHRARLETSVESRKGRKSLESNQPDFKRPTGANIRPVVIKKGNYPFVNQDLGVWTPTRIHNTTNFVNGKSFGEWILAESAKNGGTLTPERYNWYKERSDLGSDESNVQQSVRLFSQMLKEARVDGFFYRNSVEALTNYNKVPRYSRDVPYRLSPKPVDPLQDAISFVTWDANNVRSVYDTPSEVPKSQRGGAKGTWNPYEAKQQLKKLFNDWRKGSDDHVAAVNSEREALAKIKPAVDTDAKQAVFEKVGLKGVELIPEADPLSPQKLEELRNTPDIGYTSPFVPGALAVAEHNSHNKAVLWFHKLLDSGYKKGHYYHREIVRPLEDALKPLLRDDNAVSIMQDIFLRESKAKQRFTKEELTKAGVPQQIIDVYFPFREALDHSFKIQNEERKRLGMDEIPFEQAFVSHRWNGPWTVAIYEKVMKDGKPTRGKIVTYIRENNKYAANHALNYLKEKGLVNDNYIVDPVRYVGGKGDESPFRALYQDILSLVDKDSAAAQEIRRALEEEASLRTVDVGQQEKHFLKKSGTRGWRGDRPWANDDNSFIAKQLVGKAADDARDLFVQQIEYMKSAYTWASYQRAMGDARKLLSDEGFASSHQNFVKWAQEYARRHAGLGSTKVFSALENGLAQGLGTNTKVIEGIIGTSKGGFYAHTLGFGNIPFSVAQVAQPLFTSAKHNDLSARGYSHNPVVTHLQALKMVAEMAFMEGGRLSGKEEAVMRNADPLSKDAFEYMEANGMIDINPTTDIADLRMPPGLTKATHLASANVVVTEKLARTLAFASFVSHLKQSGKFPDTPQGRLDMFRMAEEATNYTMVDYRPQERAAIFDRMGLTGHMLNTFTAFKFNFMSQLYSNIKKAEAGNPMPLAYFLGTLYTLGGVSGFMGIDEADKLWELTKLGLNKIKPLPRKVEEFSVKGLIMDMPELVSIGPVSSLTGLNLYTRFSQSNTIPIDPLNPAETFKDIFPYIGVGWDITSGIAEVSRYSLLGGNKSGALAAGYKVTPPSLRGLYEEYVPGMKEGPYAQSTTEPARGGGQYPRTESDSTKRKWGFRSIDEALWKDDDFRAKKMNRMAEEKRASIAKTFRDNLVLNAPQDTVKMLNRYIEWGGDAETLFDDAEINKAWIDRNSTYLDRLIIAAQNGSAPSVDAMLTRLKKK